MLARACVPEQIPALMAGISGARPFLVDGYLCFAKENWLIFVGYPLDGRFAIERCAAAVAQARARHRPAVLWFIGPEIPADLAAGCRARQSDVYYRLDLPVQVSSALRREVRVAATVLAVCVGRAFTAEHIALAAELMDRADLSPMVAALYRAMPDYVARSPSAAVLDARDAAGRLAAFYVIEEAAPSFDVYVLGAYSRRVYVPHASDLLCATMIERAQAAGKGWINLGLGVNPGIRRFKEKWGGRPFLAYEFCEWRRDAGSMML
ncbi:MAG: TraB/GumN family protein, partial [Anaerolineae bacterium]